MDAARIDHAPPKAVLGSPLCDDSATTKHQISRASRADASKAIELASGGGTVSQVSDGTSPRREDIDLTEHAVEQYPARSRPALDHAGARAELARLVRSGEVLSAAPNREGSAHAKTPRTLAKRAGGRAHW